MAEPYLGEIKIVGFNFAPEGWSQCDGQLLPINQNQALYALLGSTYGGDGRTNFALPDLRGRTPVHDGNDIRLGQAQGTENVVINRRTMPAHTHTIKGTTTLADKGSAGRNTNRAFATVAESEPGDIIYGSLPPSPEVILPTLVPLASGIIQDTGGGQAHKNMQPSLVLNFTIALVGLFPPRN